MGIQVLGPLTTDGAALSPRERTILSALIVRSGAPLSADELADAYWGDTPPTSWLQQVKTSVARIRARLGSTAVRTVAGGYALGLDPDVVDAVRFERLVSGARSHMLHGEPERAVDAYRRALALWRGAALPDVNGWAPGVAESFRLDEVRETAEEELLGARLAFGERHTVIADAERLVHEDGLREERWAILALSNYRSDRQAEALATIKAARSRLREELGIEPSRRLADLEGAILRQDPGLDAPTPPPVANADCPYRGLESFGVDDAATFFGRDSEIERILDRLRPGAFVALAGASGCGKSSLAFAGVVPRLRARGVAIDLISATHFDELPTVRERSIVIIDQFEELFLRPEAFISARSTALRRHVAAGGTVLATVRSDFLDRCLAQPDLAALFSGGVEAVLPMSREQLRDAVEQPARAFGLRLEPGLVELILRDTAEHPMALPMLSHALVQTWRRREGTVLTVDGYVAAGGIAGAVANSAELLYGELDDDEREQLRTLMLRLVERLPDGTTIRRHTPLGPLTSDPIRAQLIARLVSTRLVSAEGDTASITHEAIAAAWPRLDGWLRDDAQDARMISGIATAADAWIAGGRAEEDLLRGARLKATLDWKSTSRPDLTSDEADFLLAAEAYADEELHAQERRAASDRRQNRRLRWSLAGVGVLLVAAIVSGTLANAAAHTATIEAVTARALSLRSTDRDLAALLAVAAYRNWPADDRSRAALIGSVTEAGPFVGTTYLPDAEWRAGMWPIPGTTHAAVVRDQVNLEIVDYRTGELVRTIPTSLERPPSIIRPWVRVSGDGSTIAVSQHFFGADDPGILIEHVSFFDVTSGHQVGSTVVTPSETDTVSLSSDGAHLTWATTGTLVVVDRDTSSVRTLELATTPPEMGWAASSAFGPDGTLYTATTEGALEVRDPISLAVQRTTTVPANRASSAMWVTADGSIFAIGATGMVSIAPDGAIRWTRGFERYWECSRPIASSAVGIAGCGDERGTVQLWNLETGSRLAEPFEYQAAGAGDLAWVDDDRELLFLSAIVPRIGHLRVDGSGIVSKVIAGGQTTLAGFDTSGEKVIVADRSVVEAGGSDTPSFAVWDVEADEPVFRVPADVADAYDGTLMDAPRWITDDLIATWLVWHTTDADGNEVEHALPKVIDTTTGRFVETGLPDDARDLYPNSDHTRVYVTTGTGESEEPIRILDTRTLQLLPLSFHTPGFIIGVTDVDGGRRILVTSYIDDGATGFRTTVFDAETGELLDTGLERMFAIAPADDARLITVGDTGLFEYATDSLERNSILPALKSRAGTLSISADGDTLLTGGLGGDRSVSLIDLTTRRTLGDALFSDTVGVAVLAPDASAFLVPVPQGVARWSLDPATQATALCRLAGREPTPDEWATYFGELGTQQALCAPDFG